MSNKITDNSPVDIHLVLTIRWYNEIEAGRKRYECREQSDYYKSRFLGNYKVLKEMHADKNTPWLYLYKNIRSIIFHKGYTNTTLRYECEGICVGYGKLYWGAPYHPVFIISLGRRMQKGCKVAKLHH